MIVLLVLTFAGADTACAHGFGQRYDLPIPLWFYLVGAGSAVAGSFVFIIAAHANRAAPQSLWWRAHIVLPAWFVFMLRATSLATFALVVAAGLLGSQSPIKNIAPVSLWVIWWVGFAFLCAFVVNLWPIANPAAVLFDGMRSVGLTRPQWRVATRLRYPAWLGAWPAVLIFLGFAWIELIAPGRDVPRAIALGALAYVGATLCGYLLFGAGLWRRRGDAFAIFFDLLGRFAPISIAYAGDQWVCRARPFAVGLLSKQPLTVSLTAFTLLMLATVTTDGLIETPPWAAVMEYFTPAGASPLARGTPPLWPPTLLLLAMPGLFALSYLLAISIMARLVPKSPSVGYLAGRFVLTLVPIAIAYHVAHYFSFLLLAGQLIFPLLSDPFGLGWDLFGTALYRMDIGIVSARTVWFVAVAAIVLGHVIATWLAHVTAMAIFVDPRIVRRSQIPMLMLMVCYTMLSLWILAQPIVEVGK